MPGLAYKVLGAVGDAGFDVDFIVQNATASATTNITFSVKRQEFERARDIIEPMAMSIGAARISVDKKIPKVSLVGVGVRSH